MYRPHLLRCSPLYRISDPPQSISPQSTLRSTTIRMNRHSNFFIVLCAGFASTSIALAQAPAAAAAPAAAPAAVAPQALNAKIALINFEQVVLASNEGQTVTANTQKKYEPKKAQIEAQNAEIETLKKNLQALPASTSDEEKGSRLRAIDAKEKVLNRDAEDATTAYNSDFQEALSKVAAKLNVVMQAYVQQNGYTLLLDVSSQTSNVLWALQATNVSQAVVDAYNKQSGVSAPPPPAPSASRARPPARPTGK